MTTAEALNSFVQRLTQALPECQGVLFASTDGLLLAHQLRSGDAQSLAAMAATAIGLGKRITETVSGGQLSETSVQGTQGSFFIYTAGGTGVLAVMAPPEANVGLINLEARKVAQEAAAVMRG